MDLYELAANNPVAKLVKESSGNTSLCSLSGDRLLREDMPCGINEPAVQGSLSVIPMQGEYGLLFMSDDEFTVSAGLPDMPGFKTRSLEISNETITVPSDAVDLSKNLFCRS